MKKLFLYTILLCLIVLPGCSGSDDDDGDYNVMYEVSTDQAENASISYINEHGDLIELPAVNIENEHWVYTFYGDQGADLYLSAQLVDAEGSIRVTIYVYGEELDSQLSWGQDIPATVSGTL